MTLLLCTLRYGLSYITFHPYNAWARYSYRTAFVAAAATYGIVVYKAYRARARAGSRQQGGPLALVGDENVQYLGLSSTTHSSVDPNLTCFPLQQWHWSGFSDAKFHSHSFLSWSTLSSMWRPIPAPTFFLLSPVRSNLLPVLHLAAAQQPKPHLWPIRLANLSKSTTTLP